MFILELIYFRLANKFNIIDRPNERSSHKTVTIRGGGVIFYFGILLYFLFSKFEYPWFFIGLSFISIVSFIDDVRSLPNRYRIIIHFISILLMCYQWGIIRENDWWLVIPSLILCVGIINAYNFMDGINGITGGYTLAVLIPLLLLNNKLYFADERLIAVAIMSVIVFCFFNFRNKAKCFAGDVGSVSIAFIVLFVLGLLIIKTGKPYYLLFLVVYGVDTVLTICHRLMLGENIFHAHRKHLYQIMSNELRIPHLVVSTIYLSSQFIISIGLIYLPINKWYYTVFVTLSLALIYVLFMKKYYHLHVEYLNSVVENNQ